MSARSKVPHDDHADDAQTEVFDPTGARPKRPTSRGLAPQRAKGLEAAHQKRGGIDQATPTEVDARAPVAPVRHERSEPIRVISMKTPADLDTGPHRVIARQQRPVVQLRALSEVSGENQRRHVMERLAPPRDAREVRARRVRDYVIWGSVVVIVGSAVMLGVWFVAR